MSIESTLQSAEVGGLLVRQQLSETGGMFLARVQFVRDHLEEMGAERALTCSIVFSNKHFLGCSYPREVEEGMEGYPAPQCIDAGFDSMTKRRMLARKRPLRPVQSPPPSQGAVSHVFPLDFQQLCKNMSLSPWREAEDVASNPTTLLIHFAQKNGHTCIFHDTTPTLPLSPPASFRVEIEGVTIAIGDGPSKARAKKEAALRAIEAVFHCQKVIGHLSRPKRDPRAQQVVSRSDIARGTDGPGATGVWEDRGLKLLQSAGWSGSPEELGDGGGETAQQSLHRAGLGSASGEELSGGVIEQRLQEFLDSQEEDLVFSSELSPDERKLVHVLAQRFGLKHSSSGQGDSRYLVVSKRSTSNPPAPFPMSSPHAPEFHPGYGQPPFRGSFVPPPDRYHSHRGWRGRGRGRGRGWNQRERTGRFNPY